MREHTSGTREEWLAARLELLQAEKELTRRSDELARRRRELPWVRIDVTPPPVLPELERSGDRMMGGVKMLRGVAVL